MTIPREFSEPLEIPAIPDGPGLIIIEDGRGEVLQVARSENIRQRIGELFDNRGKLCVHGPKVYEAQQAGRRIFVRWKLGDDSNEAKRDLISSLNPTWRE